MKRVTMIFVIALISITLMAQNKVVDKLFEKYADEEGFTSVVITKHMFNLFSSIETEEDDDYMNMIKNLNNIRILSGPSGEESGINFYNEIMNKLPESDYEELMVIHDSGQDIKFLIKTEKKIVSELLMIVGGEGDNVLISITGNIDMKTVSKLSQNMGIQGMEKLDKMDDSKKKK